MNERGMCVLLTGIRRKELPNEDLMVKLEEWVGNKWAWLVRLLNFVITITATKKMASTISKSYECFVAKCLNESLLVYLIALRKILIHISVNTIWRHYYTLFRKDATVKAVTANSYNFLFKTAAHINHKLNHNFEQIRYITHMHI